MENQPITKKTTLVFSGTAAKIAGKSPDTILYWRRIGKIHGKRFSNAAQSWWMFDSDEIRRVSNERRMESAF
jgi:hypothetical protein